MSDELWNEVLNDLKTYGALIDTYLLIDGYRVRPVVVSDTNNFLKRSIFVYIDRRFEARWCNPHDEQDKEIASRFLRPAKKCFSSVTKLRKDGWRKKDAEAFVAKSTYQYYDPAWSSFESMKRHFIKKNKSISLVKEADDAKPESSGSTDL